MSRESMQLLLIEDNPGDQRLIHEMLRQSQGLHFDVRCVGRLAEGVHILAEETFDVVLLDLSLPDSSGLETLNNFRNNFRDIPVIVLTGFSNTDIGLQAVQAGAQDYLVKDEVTSNLLRRTIQYAIERHRTEKQLRKREEEYRSLIDDVFNSSTVAVFILDQDCNIVWVNEAVSVYFGLKRDEIIGLDKRELIRDQMSGIFDEPSQFVTTMLDLYDSHEFGEATVFHVLADPECNREERWIEYFGRPVTAGLYAGGRIEQYTDVSVHVRTEIAVRQQRTLAEALSDSAVALTSTLDIDEVLDRILENVGSLVPHDTAKIYFVREGVARVVRANGFPGAEVLDERLGIRLKVEDHPYFRYMRDSGAPIAIVDIQDDDDWIKLPGDEQLHACVAAPVRLQDRTIGFISLLSTERDRFGSEHAQHLHVFTAQAATAIQNAQHYEQSRELVAMGERQRIARDLHDAVTQSLFSANIIAQSLPRLWQRNPERVIEQLDHLHELTQSALTEMRMLLMELRPEALQDVALSELLQRLAVALQTRKQIPVSLSVDSLPDLPEAVKTAFYRIAQESLNNAAKHAGASRIDLALRCQDNDLSLEIRDDGMGFDGQAATSTSYGLKIMHERSEEIGAVLQIASQQGQGTTVIVHWSSEALATPEH